MDKKIIIGGVGVVLIGGFLYIRAKNKADVQAANSEGQASVIQSSGSIPYADSSFSSLSPISGGISSSGYDNSNLAPASADNSGSGSSGGGFSFDMGAIMDKFLGLQANNQSAQIKANATTADSAILATIVGNTGRGEISHTGNSTSITLRSPVEQIVYDEYFTNLGRAPDAAGGANAVARLINDPGFSVADLHNSILNSEEYKLKQEKDKAAK